MAAKKTKGVIVVLADSKDPAKFDEFKDWYNNVHGPDIVGTGSFYASNRYVNRKRKDRQLAAIHETAWDDIVEAATHMNKSVPEWREKGRLYGEMQAGHFGRYKRIF